MLKTYDPSQVFVVLGPAVVTDFEKVTIERDEDRWSYYTGSGGEITRTKNVNKLGQFSVEIPQSSAVNLVLSQLINVDYLFSAEIKDGNGYSIYTIPQASVQRVPTSEFSKKESTTRTWIIKGELATAIVGGNN